jgi:hypothetical protein
VQDFQSNIKSGRIWQFSLPILVGSIFSYVTTLFVVHSPTQAGHIPSSINVGRGESVKNGLFMNTERSVYLYSKIPLNSKIVTYCRGRYRAADTLLAFKIPGYPEVKMYWSFMGNG